MRHTLIRRAAAAAAVCLAVLVPVGMAAWAAEADGCSGSAISYDKDGKEIDQVRAPGWSGTREDPFEIDLAGSVAWKGRTQGVITNGSWWVTVGGFPFRSGEFTNDERLDRSSGTVDMSTLPGPVQTLITDRMLVLVEGRMSGDGGTCMGAGWITGVTPVLGSPLFWAAFLSGGLGFALLILMIARTSAMFGTSDQSMSMAAWNAAAQREVPL